MHKSQCVTTLPSGERLGHHLDGKAIEVKDALICVATDPQTGQVRVLRREETCRMPNTISLLMVSLKEHSSVICCCIALILGILVC